MSAQNAGPDFEGALADLIADDPMWIGDDGQPLDYLPEREALIADFVGNVAAALRAEVGRWLEGEGARDVLAEALWPNDGGAQETWFAQETLNAALSALAEQVGQVASVGEGEG